MIGKSRIAVLIMCSLFFLSSISILAEEEEVLLTIDDTSLELGTSGNLVITIPTKDEILQIGVSGIEDFEIMSQSQTSSTQIINGVSTSQQSINLVIMPKSTGTFTLEAIVEYKDKTLESKVLQITVVEGDSSLQEEGEDVFLKTIVSKNDMYFGEKVVVSYELYTRYNVENFGFTDEVSPVGFIISETAEENLTANYITINGQNYLKYQVKQMVLTPTQLGELNIPAYNFQVNISSGDFFSRAEPRYLMSDEIKMSVKEIPTEGSLEPITGLVGTFDLKYSYDKDSVNYGEPVTLNVLLTGTGNFEVLKSIYGKEQKDFILYETGKAVEDTFIDDLIVSTKEFEIILIPKETGDLVFKPVRINYFDTQLGAYKYIEIPGTTIHVSGEKPENNSQSLGTNNSQSPMVISQVSYNTISQEDAIVIRVNKKIVYIVIAVITLLGILLIILRQLIKNRKVNPVKQYITEVQKAKTHEELYQCIHRFVVEFFGLSLKASSKKEVIKNISNPNIREEIGEIIDYLEYDQFYSNINLEDIKAKIIQIMGYVVQ